MCKNDSTGSSTSGFNRRSLIQGAGIAGASLFAASAIGVTPAAAAVTKPRADFATWDPVADRSTSAIDPVRVIVHIAVTRSEDPLGPESWDGDYPHFYNPQSGKVRQHQDLNLRSAAQVNGNSSSISVEHAGLEGDDMTAAQLDSMARIFAWAVCFCGVPNRIATAADTRGLAWHRLGVEGNFPAYNPNDPKTWCRRDTGEVWSTAFGKSCPTDKFIDKIPAIFNRAQDWIAHYRGGPSWHLVPGTLAQLDLGPQGELWGVNAAGTIYSYAGGGDWAAHGSDFKNVTVGAVSDGGPHVYALKTNGSIQRWTGSAWQPVSGVLTQLDLGPQGDLWGVNAAGTIFEYAGSGTWTARGSGFKNVTVGKASDGGPHVYAVKTNNTVQRWTGSSWQGVGGALSSLSFGPQGELWGVNAAGTIHQYAGSGSWTVRGSGFKNVSVGSATGSHVYAVRTDGTIQRWGTA